MKNKELKAIANAIRGLSIDAIQKANSGHPGLPMGMADVASVLFSKYMRFNPKEPNWLGRDRFVLSGGHGSMLLYSLLHLFGYDVSIDDIKNFRQWGSKTPGHPEYGHTSGVETTTGPLGQGFANSVGMAIGQKHFQELMDKKYSAIFDNYTYVFLGDGDLEEGISHEVASLAGHLKLDKLIVFYDSNDITIDGKLSLSCSDDAINRFKSYGWNTLEIDGHDYDSIDRGIQAARSYTDKPTILITKTVIGYGSPNKAGTSSVHGSPLGEEELLMTKSNLGISEEKFFVSKDVYDLTKKVINKNEEYFSSWSDKFEEFKKSENYKLFKKIENKDFDAKLLDLNNFKFPDSIATRSASAMVLDKIFENTPSLIGGSADLTPSNNTKPKEVVPFSAEDRKGRYIHYGIREHGMAGIMNGLALYNGFIPFGGTFLVFSDYMRPSIRMAALMKQQCIFVFTHDSIGLGEDGPTHQPVEQIASLRLIPNVINFRPMDANETVIAWKVAIENHTSPTNIILSRQKLPTIKGGASAENATKGAYVLKEDDNYQVILMASGSEVQTTLEAKELLNKRGINVRVVSMPSMELFEKQSKAYKNSVIDANCSARVAVEAGKSDSWYKYVGEKGIVLGIDDFGASAPYQKLYQEFGITPDNVVEKVLTLII